MNEFLEILDWQMRMGVDELIAAEPVDRFAAIEEKKHIPPANPLRKPQAPEPPPRPEPRPSHAPVAVDEAVLAARYEARECQNLDELKSALEKFEGCGLKVTAKQLCFADGNPDARIMLIGEGPGREEDLQGKPFVGRAGKLLDKMLAAIGIDRHNEDPGKAAYIANVVPWRPPGNRNPTPAETAICRPFIDRQVELMKPEIVVFLGGVSAKEMLDTTTGIMRLRGKWREFETENAKFRAIATFHPAFLLRQPAQKRLAWRDMLEIRAALDA